MIDSLLSVNPTDALAYGVLFTGIGLGVKRLLRKAKRRSLIWYRRSLRWFCWMRSRWTRPALGQKWQLPGDNYPMEIVVFDPAQTRYNILLTLRPKYDEYNSWHIRGWDDWQEFVDRRKAVLVSEKED